MKRIIIKNKLVGSIAFIVFVLFFASLLFYNQKMKEETYEIEYDWKVHVNGNLYERQPESKLIQYVLPNMKKGNIIELSHKMEDFKIKDAGIIFDTWHAIVEVYVDKEKVYSWGLEYYDNEMMLGAKRHKIILPDHYIGKNLVIKLTTTEDYAMKKFESVAVSSFSEEKHFWFNRPFLIIFSGFLFFIFGFIVFLLPYFTLIKKDVFLSSIMLGSSFMLMGIYFLCRAKIIHLLIPDPLVYNQIEFLTLYILPITLMAYTFNLKGIYPSKNLKIFYKMYIIFYAILVFTSFLLNNYSNIHYASLLNVIYIGTIVGYLLCYLALKTSKEKILWIKITLLAIKTFFLGALLSIIAFHAEANPQINRMFMLWKYYEYILVFVTFVMLVLFFIGFYLNLKQMLLLKIENEKLDYMAHYDSLTMIKNRRSFNEKLQELKLQELSDGKGRKKFSIAVIDLNNLKMINDSMGHSVGDKMIISIANAMEKIAKKNVENYRIGGDEFVIIANDIENIEDIINNLIDEIEKYNLKSQKGKISVAIGTSKSSEGSDVYELFDLADKRMYEFKKMMKTESI